ncbi:MAG: hypoxanthine phosphoribosyltransferase [Oscillospiraceae bacterium]|jgi:hypoxanthine phosphoribosyltransferase|nr:hypoxanthine phosphoribosyltransferase [Oscillospiraceae bacterium]
MDVLLSEEQIQTRVRELAKQISEDFSGKPLMAVCVLKGAYAFFSDLVRALSIPAQIEFVRVASYQGTQSGAFTVLHDIPVSLEGFHVLLIDDILDSGKTMKKLLKHMGAKNPLSLSLCTLLEKPGQLEAPVTLEYCGFQIPNEFVVGYGLDCDQQHRTLPYIARYQAD